MFIPQSFHDNIYYEYSVNIVSSIHIVIYMYIITILEETLGFFYNWGECNRCLEVFGTTACSRGVYIT